MTEYMIYLIAKSTKHFLYFPNYDPKCKLSMYVHKLVAKLINAAMRAVKVQKYVYLFLT